MIYSGHQISFIPWIGYWKKINDSDFFDLSIYEQFTKSTWIHYTQIGNNDNLVKWKLPVEREFIDHSYKYKITDIKVLPGFADSMLKQFYDVHHNDKYFEFIYPLLEKWLKEVQYVDKLWLINLILTEKIYNLLQLNTKMAILPNFDDKDDATTKIVKQTESIKCDKYLSGPHGINYLDLNKFKEKNIQVEFQDTTYFYENYRQSIVSLISIYGLDYVLNLLKNSIKY